MSLPRATARAGQAISSAKARASLMFFTGLGLTIREAVVKGPERPSLYVLYAGMMGLPFVWGKGAEFPAFGGKENGKKGDGEESPE